MGDIIEKNVTNGLHSDNKLNDQQKNNKTITEGKRRVSLFKLNSKSQRDNA